MNQFSEFNPKEPTRMAIFERTKQVKTPRVHLKSNGGFCINGKHMTEGQIVEVSEQEAKDLVGRGKAVDATPGEVSAAGAEIEVAPIMGGSSAWQDAA
ncbi:MAG: hypothetical protein E6Q88_11225 [Lysobacteraceae bacterium]|nr:MAG: hypothetical protein E6Q88_11225 [Xanthomonadaceae bacterium]